MGILPLQVYGGRGGFRDCFSKIKAEDHKKLAHASPLKKAQNTKFKTMAEVHQVMLSLTFPLPDIYPRCPCHIHGASK